MVMSVTTALRVLYAIHALRHSSWWDPRRAMIEWPTQVEDHWRVWQMWKKKHWRKSTSVLRLDWSSVLARVFFTQIGSLFGNFFDFFCLHRFRVGPLFEAISVCVRIRVPLRYRDDMAPSLQSNTLAISSYSAIIQLQLWTSKHTKFITQEHEFSWKNWSQIWIQMVKISPKMVFSENSHKVLHEPNFLGKFTKVRLIGPPLDLIQDVLRTALINIIALCDSWWCCFCFLTAHAQHPLQHVVLAL